MIIEIVRGSENTPKTMSFRNEEELFYEEFLQASEALAEILNTTVEYNRRDKARRNITLYENNVIAFCGKRGQGKTSLMRSFTDTLDDEDHEAFKKNISHSFEQIRNTKFFVLPLIDPTVLTESDSILNVILSRLFKKVQLKEDRIGNVVKGRELMEHFQRCMDDIAAIHGKKDGIAVFDNLDQLERMGDSSDIVEHFHELIKNILCYVQMDPSKDHVVIPLDDTDLQFELAYDILEDIFVKPSKYLHNIFPTTMRGLAHLLSLLASMQDIPEVTVSTDAGVEYLASEDTVKQFEEQTKIALKNLQLFEDYFFHEWCADKLEPKHCEMLSKASGVTLNLRIRKNNNLYQVQAFCLMIVLNWDVQHLMYKCEDFFAQKELPLQPGTLSEAPKLSRRYLLLWENLKSHLQWETASTYYNEFSNLVNSTAFQGAFYDFQCTCEAFRVWRNENLHQFFQSRKSTYNSEGRLITTADDSKTELPVSPNAAAAGSGDGLENLLEQCKKCFPDVGECFKKIYDKSKGQQKPPIEPYKDELQAMGINGETFNAFFAMIS